MMYASRIAVWIAAASAVAVLSWPPDWSPVHLAYNPSTSAPQGWYLVSRAHEFRVNDYVMARLPTDAATLAKNRHYLPLSVPILKRIGAVSNQFVCVSSDGILIDDHVVASVLRSDSHGRNLAIWAHCRVLFNDELFLLSVTNPASFDSRYFGPIERGRVIGKAVPLWTW